MRNIDAETVWHGDGENADKRLGSVCGRVESDEDGVATRMKARDWGRNREKLMIMKWEWGHKFYRVTL